MYVHPVMMMVLVAVLSALVTMLVMNHPGGMSPGMHGGDSPAAMADSGSNLQLYYSTMHPWIVQDHPGTCPICGMELVKMQPADQAEYLANHPELM
jgi:hypothetical protein